MRIAGLRQVQWNHYTAPKFTISPSSQSPWAQVTEPAFFLWMNSFPRDTKSLLKFATHITQVTNYTNGAKWRICFFPQVYPYPEKSVARSNVGRENMLFLGTPHMGCVQSVFLVSWDFLLFMHMYIYASIHMYVQVDITHVIVCNNSLFIFIAIWYSIYKHVTIYPF